MNVTKDQQLKKYETVHGQKNVILNCLNFSTHEKKGLIFHIFFFVLVASVFHPSVNAATNLVGCGSSVADASRVFAEPIFARPTLRQPYIEPVFGACVQRITDHAINAAVAVPAYSQNQAWNADQSLLLLQSGEILDAKTFARLHTINYGWPAWGNGARWSQTEPTTLYYTGGVDAGNEPDAIACPVDTARLMRYRLNPGTPMTASRQLVACFPEYRRFDKDRSFQEMSLDGRYIALEGYRKSDGRPEIFVYDVVNKRKSATLEAPILNGSQWNVDWAGISPLGNYLILSWGGGGADRYRSVEAFDFKSNPAQLVYVGKVATGHGHSDMAVDESGTEWYVDYSPDNYIGVTGPLIKKNRIPKGYDDYVAGDRTGIQSLLRLDWETGMHISCQNAYAGWCAGEFMSANSNGIQPFEDELAKIYLDSTEAKPHVERLVHHRSDTELASNCNIGIGYWAQPHPTVSRDSSQIIYGSNWENNCFVESYLISLGQPQSSDNIAPQVNISNPAAGANLSGTAVTLVANASDNVGVAGVQFRIDGSNMGAEDNTAPYSLSLNTTLLANGAHTISAVARDAASNRTTSTAINVNINNTVPDTTLPQVSITTPANGTTVNGTAVAVTANASDNVGVAGVQFRIDGANVGVEDTSAPFSVSINTTLLTNGSHSLTAVARDAAGNRNTSATVSITVNNVISDTILPSVAISAPANGTTVSGGAVTITANASDNVGVAGVQFRVDGSNFAEDTTAPYFASLDTTALANGSHNISVVARDAAGNSATSSITVTVSNVGNPDDFDFASLAANTWYRVAPQYDYTVKNSTGGGVFQSRGWGTMRYNDANKSVLFYEGYGPSDHGSYCIYANALYEFFPGQSRVKMDSLSDYWCGGDNNKTIIPMLGVTPATPKDRHTYSQFAYAPTVNKLYVAYGASGSCNHPYDMWSYSFDAGTWQKLSNLPIPTESGCASGVLEANLIFRPATNELYLFAGQNRVHAYNVASNTTRQVPTSGSSGVIGSRGTYDSKRDRFVFFGNGWTGDNSGSQNLVFFDAATNTWQQQAVTGSWPSARQYAPIEYIAKWDVYLLQGGAGRNDTWIYDPSTNRWTQLATTGALPPVGGSEFYMTYDPAHDVVVRGMGSGGEIWMMRYKGSSTADTTAPQVAITAPASGSSVSGTGITVTANASDSVGVTGVQFRVDGNNSGAEDTTAPYSTTLNTTLLANGNHTISAIARDAAGNRTTSSGVVITVNNVPNDVAPPVLSNGSPTGNLAAGTSQISLRVVTNEAASCRYTTMANTAYGNMTGIFSTTGATSHSTVISGLSNGRSYTYYLRCQDAAGNAVTSDYSVTFTVSSASTSSSKSSASVSSAVSSSSSAISGRTLKVGPGQTFTTIKAVAAAAQHGDTVEIDAGLYTSDYAIWTANNLTIRGVGGGRAHLRASAPIPNGKAIWVITGSNTTVENIEFSGATVPDQNGAGIRQEGPGLTVRNSYFHHNETGILTGAHPTSDILIENSEFAYNGFGDGRSHNMYIGNIRKFTLRYSYSHHTRIGHNVKTRAQENHIFYNRIMDEVSGTGSYAIDMSNGGRSYLIGNLIQQGRLTDNSTIVAYAPEGGANADQHLYVVNNTIVNDREGGTFLSVTGITPAVVKNNLFVGNGTVYRGPGSVNLTSENLLTNAGLVNRGGFDYRLTTDSGARDRGTDPGSVSNVNLRPTYEYVHPLGRKDRSEVGAIDFGAYEYGQSTSSANAVSSISSSKPMSSSVNSSLKTASSTQGNVTTATSMATTTTATPVDFTSTALSPQVSGGGSNVVKAPNLFECRYASNESYCGFTETVNYNREVFIKMDMKFGTNFDFAQGQKILRVRSYNASAGLNNWDFIAQITSRANATGQAGTNNSYQITVSRNSGATWGTFDKTFNRGQWYSFQYRFLLNSAPGVKDGVFQMWLDGVQIFNITGLELTSGATWNSNINRILWGGWYSNGAGGNTHPNPEPSPSTYEIRNPLRSTQFISNASQSSSSSSTSSIPANATPVDFTSTALSPQVSGGGSNVVKAPNLFECRYASNESYCGFTETVNYNREVFIKMDMKFGTSFDFGQGQKILRVRSYNASAGLNNWDFIAQITSRANATGQAGTNDSYQITVSRNSGATWGTFDKTFNRGQWYSFQYRFLLNSAPGVKDGVFQMWLDGVQIFNITGLELTSGATWNSTINRILWGGWYSNGAGGNTHPNPEPSPSTYEIRNPLRSSTFIP